MSTVASLPEVDGVRAQPQSRRKGRRIFVSFAGLITIGLALAGWYVGERILAAQSHSDGNPQSVASQAITAPAPVIQPAVSTSSSPAQDEALVPDDIASDEQHDAPAQAGEVLLPLAAEYYLQVAALGTAQDFEYLKQLQRKGFTAYLDTGAKDGAGFIWIGPYADQTKLQRAQSRLVSAGILAIETVR